MIKKHTEKNINECVYDVSVPRMLYYVGISHFLC